MKPLDKPAAGATESVDQGRSAYKKMQMWTVKLWRQCWRGRTHHVEQLTVMMLVLGLTLPANLVWYPVDVAEHESRKALALRSQHRREMRSQLGFSVRGWVLRPLRFSVASNTSTLSMTLVP
ncbi:hypothetical protein PHYPSEUDO_014830 [Phytophthora pseudosyringae]|uniref:Uncharacterized protein n=1 Tax=Phytophthora pseudosyringae TaxID=221518 RepID=A0A8T1V4H9_9STRA|nr:hypothetical protein PHYPSEUDO_014830 [Phytophthora pseudosyringae]